MSEKNISVLMVMLFGAIMVILGVFLITTYEEKSQPAPASYETTIEEEQEKASEKLNKAIENFEQAVDGVIIDLKEFEKKNG